MSIPDSIVVSPNSRFSVHENPNVAPGVCCVCRNAGGDGRFFVDFGFQLDWYGAVYFCSECIRELCGTIGFVPSGEVANLKEALGVATLALKHIQEEFEEYRGSVSILLRNCTCNDVGGNTGRSNNSQQNRTKSKSVGSGKDEADREPDKAGGS